LSTFSEENMKIYRHYKTKTLYEHIGQATHSETNEELVIYQSVTTGRMWARPAEMFFGEVEVDGKMVKRFEKVLNKPGDNPCGEVAL
jgi:hypothetical protein